MTTAGSTRERAGADLALWSLATAFRTAALVYAAVRIALGAGGFARPGLGWAVLAALAGWTLVTCLAYRRPSGRRPLLLAADVAVAVAAVLATRVVDTPAHVSAGSPTLPVAWAAAPVLTVAAFAGPAWGTAAAAAVAVADVVERGALAQPTVNGIVLLLAAAALVGQLIRTERRVRAAEARAARLEAAAAERDRIARHLHDSVLQLLALIARRGPELGGDAAGWARVAADAEADVRRLVGTGAAGPGDHAVPGRSDGRTDVAGALAPHAAERVTVSGPGEPVWLPSDVAGELVAAVDEALSNVGRHAGPGARAWVHLDDDGEQVTVVVRDDGAGIAPGRLAAAELAGRLGVAQSIVGRLRALGGDATIVSSPGTGTEVELRVPRSREKRAR